jgi:hypothetical protein
VAADSQLNVAGEKPLDSNDDLIGAKETPV